MQKLLIAFIAGLIYPLGFSPWSQWLGLGDGTGWPLMMASIALGWWTLDGANRRQARRVGGHDNLEFREIKLCQRRKAP